MYAKTEVCPIKKNYKLVDQSKSSRALLKLMKLNKGVKAH